MWLIFVVVCLFVFLFMICGFGARSYFFPRTAYVRVVFPSKRLSKAGGEPCTAPEERKEKTVSHVLGTFKSNEISLVEEVLEEVTIGFHLIQKLGFEKAGNRLNAYKPNSIESL